MEPHAFWVAARDRRMIDGLRYRRFVALSARTRQELMQYHGVPAGRIRVIPNGIALDRFWPDAAAGASIRAEFGVPEGAVLLLFAGHEFARKGLAYVAEAMRALPDHVWLLVVGSDDGGPYRAAAGPAATRMLFAGHRRDMPALYAAADAVVLPTAYETFSLVCMEAMACGVPVFATAAGGIEDYLQDGVNGRFVQRTGRHWPPCWPRPWRTGLGCGPWVPPRYGPHRATGGSGWPSATRRCCTRYGPRSTALHRLGRAHSVR